LVVLSGRVLDSNCRPIAGAVLDFWQTGDTGEYDTHGYGYRGHQYTDAEGRFELLSIRPSEYTALGLARTPHIHVKVQGADTGLLTAQLFFPDATETNTVDPIFNPAMLVQLHGKQDRAQLASFDFVLART
jgi:protocatechuate 3,4-dioxygenase beta subunit